jgi:hypothetical protein
MVVVDHQDRAIILLCTAMLLMLGCQYLDAKLHIAHIENLNDHSRRLKALEHAWAAQPSG